jgi:hypothetical protein
MPTFYFKSNPSQTLTVDLRPQLNPSGTALATALSCTEAPAASGYYSFASSVAAAVLAIVKDGSSNTIQTITTTLAAVDKVIDDDTQPDNTSIAAIKTNTDNLTPTRAGYLDRLDVAISTRSTYAGADTAGTTTLLGRITGAVPLAADYTPTRAAKLDNLDAAVSTRSTYAGAVPDNAGIAAIKAKTDNLPASPASETAATTNTSTITTAISTLAAVFSGITSMANWLRLLARSGAGNATALTELNTGGGSYATATHSLQAAATDQAGIAGTVSTAVVAALSGVNVSISSPTARDGKPLLIVQGDDYKSADSRSITISVTGTPSLSGAAATLKLRSVGVLVTTTGTIGTPSGGATPIAFELTAAQTASLPACQVGGERELEIVLASGNHLTVSKGTLIVERQLS